MLVLIFAEGENGRRDFVQTTKKLSFAPSSGPDEQSIFLDFIDDDINEASEGFYAVLNLDTSLTEDQRDVENFDFLLGGVTLLIIDDDDRKFVVCSLIIE